MPIIRQERIPKSEQPKKGRDRALKAPIEVAAKGLFLLKKLYEMEQGQEKKHMTQIAEDLGISVPKMSKTVKPLVDHGLVSLVSEGREKNDRRKFLKLTTEGRRLTTLLMEAEKTPTQEEVISEKDLKDVIKTLTDDGLGTNVKRTAASLLRDACSSAKFENRDLLQEFFSNVVDNMEKYEKDEFIDVFLSLEHYLGSQLREGDVEWFREVYKRLLSIFKSEAPINTRKRALKVLGSVYQKGRKEGWMAIFVAELAKIFEETFFDPEEGKDIAERCWYILREQAHNGELEKLMDRLYEGAKSQDKNLRDRCENRLIEVLQSRWKKSDQGLPFSYSV